MSDKVTISSGKGFKFLKDTLRETNQQKVEIRVIHVPNPKTNSIHHVNLEIIKYVKKPSQPWSSATTSKIRLTSEKPEESIQKLLVFLRAQSSLEKYTNAVVEIARSPSNSLTAEDMEFVRKILSSFDTPEKRELLVRAKKEDVQNLYAAVKHAKNKKATLELRELIDNDNKEIELQKWIKDNTWVFGVEYINFIDKRKIGLHSESDFIVQSLDGYADLIELKKPGVQLFNYDSSHDSYYPSSELSKVIGQAIKYLNVMEENKAQLKNEDEIDVLKPRIKIVVGRSSKFIDKEKQALRLLNDSLHNIEIITYDEVKKRADRMIEHFSNQEFAY